MAFLWWVQTTLLSCITERLGRQKWTWFLSQTCRPDFVLRRPPSLALGSKETAVIERWTALLLGRTSACKCGCGTALLARHGSRPLVSTLPERSTAPPLFS